MMQILLAEAPYSAVFLFSDGKSDTTPCERRQIWSRIQTYLTKKGGNSNASSKVSQIWEDKYQGEEKTKLYSDQKA